jgi:hypothetical protein
MLLNVIASIADESNQEEIDPCLFGVTPVDE